MIVATARDAADLLAPRFADATGERVVCLFLDRRRAVLGLREGAVEGAASAELPLRAIIASALARGADGLVLAHNHPSGDPEPSLADIAATRRLAEVAAGLDIRLHDHLIFAGRDVRSFRALGLL